MAVETPRILMDTVTDHMQKNNYCSGIGVITIYTIFDLMKRIIIFNNWCHMNNLQNS